MLKFYQIQNGQDQFLKVRYKHSFAFDPDVLWLADRDKAMRFEKGKIGLERANGWLKWLSKKFPGSFKIVNESGRIILNSKN